MLHSVELQNFKAFRNLNNLPIKPITVLCGTNSCGKSTILQSILLAKQTSESKQRGQTLQLNGRFVRLGTFENLVFEKSSNNRVTIGLSFQMKRDQQKRSMPSGYRNNYLVEDVFSEKDLKISPAEYYINYRIGLSLAKRRSPITHVKPIVINSLELSAKIKTPGGDTFEGAGLSLTLKERDIYQLEWSNFKGRRANKSGRAIIKTKFNNLFPNNLHVVNKPRKESRIPGVDFTVFAYQDFLETMFSSISYIGPLREEPSRRYVYENEVLEIGNKGENSAFICLTESDKRIKNCYFFDKVTDTFSKSDESVKLIDALQQWLDLLGITGFKPRTNSEIISLDLESNSSSKHTRVSIADVGFGVSQILPIILEGLRMPVGGTLLLEQPEIHLHPNLQMQLADYLISLALAKKYAIVETHSDHIINRLVRRIVEDTTLNLEDLIGIYFIKPSEKGSVFEEVHVDPDSGIVNWPNDFFDQTASEQQKIIEAGLKKRLVNKDIPENVR